MRQHSKTPHYLTGICGVREDVCRVRQTAGQVCPTGQRGCVAGQTLSAQPDIVCPAREALSRVRQYLPGETMSPLAHQVIKK